MLELLTWENLIALLTLTLIETVLGIDNLVFLSVVTGRLPPEQRPLARRLGLLGAMLMRIGLLLSITWLMTLQQPLFTAVGKSYSGKDLILLVGGLFLLWKGTKEIHHKLEDHDENLTAAAAASFGAAIAQIMVIDVVFSLDSVITAVGMAQSIVVMVTAVMLSIGVMLAFAGKISALIEAHPTLKVLALSFVILIGVFLVAEATGHHIEKGYIYFAMAFSLAVEVVNLRISAKRKKRPAGA
jgi:predicted tellurium resistance membrane protein TerC